MISSESQQPGRSQVAQDCRVRQTRILHGWHYLGHTCLLQAVKTATELISNYTI